MQKWEYLSVRFNYKGRGITQEFNELDINGKNVISGGSAEADTAKMLPDFLSGLGEAGWELVNHTVEAEIGWHYMHFKRPRTA
jgi:hypothetical protein